MKKASNITTAVVAGMLAQEVNGQFQAPLSQRPSIETAPMGFGVGGPVLMYDLQRYHESRRDTIAYNQFRSQLGMTTFSPFKGATGFGLRVGPFEAQYLSVPTQESKIGDVTNPGDPPQYVAVSGVRYKGARVATASFGVDLNNVQNKPFSIVGGSKFGGYYSDGADVHNLGAGGGFVSTNFGVQYKKSLGKDKKISLVAEFGIQNNLLVSDTNFKRYQDKQIKLRDAYATNTQLGLKVAAQYNHRKYVPRKMKKRI